MIVYYKEHELHNDPSHPENKKRVEWVMKELKEKGILEKIDIIDPPINFENLLIVHEKEYVEKIENLILNMKEDLIYLDPDTYICKDSWIPLVKAVNSGIIAIDLLEETKNVFCFTRPPGHHAGKDYFGGFCIFNNIATAAVYSLEKYKKVLILDIDYHHGNGTQDIVQNYPNIYYVSLHRYGVFPGTGSLDENKENVLNIPLPPRVTDEEYLYLIKEVVVPFVENIKPDIILISAGYDTYYKDPLGDFKLKNAYYWIFEEIKKYKKVVFLEGGYSKEGLINGILQTLNSLFNLNLEVEEVKIVEEKIRDYIKNLAKNLKESYGLA